MKREEHNVSVEFQGRFDYYLRFYNTDHTDSVIERGLSFLRIAKAVSLF